jgi:hypothetical protein
MGRDVSRARALAASYGAAALFLLLVATGDAITALLSLNRLAAMQQWASTNVANLEHHPAPALLFSAFLPSESGIAWLFLIALALFGANRALGNIRLFAVCAAGHVVGTGVSDAILAYRIDHGQVPATMARIIDIGPSYVVVSAIVVVILLGTLIARAAAVAAFAMLVFFGHIFAGLTRLDVAAVGHVTAMLVAAVVSLAVRPRNPVPEQGSRRYRFLPSRASR